MTATSLRTVDHDAIRYLLQVLEDQANAVVFEREVEVACFIAALLARCHISLVGPPGVAKTFLGDAIRLMIDGLEGDAYFETQLGPHADVGDLFGSHTIDGLRLGKRVRNTERMLPRAKVAHISEFWNAPDGAIKPLNSVLNEGFFFNGAGAEPCDLSTLIIDSNGLPPAGHPLADRFTFWHLVRPLQNRSSVQAMLAGANERLATTGTSRRPNVPKLLSWDQIAQAQHDVARIPVPPAVTEALVDLRFKLADEDIFPSDRRMTYCLAVMKASAYRAGRSQATEDDMELLAHVLWTKPEHLPKVQRLIYAVANPHDMEALKLSDRVQDMVDNYATVTRMTDPVGKRRAALELHRKAKAAAEELAGIRTRSKASGRRLALFSPLRATITDLGAQCLDLLPKDESPETHP